MFADVEGPSFIFWPVGCGDSTTIVVSDSEVIQIDLNDTLLAANDDNERIPLVDELVAKLPKRDGKPYLSCFVLTHPDLDHCRGFADLLERATIGELWHTPRIFREYQEDLSEDAIAFAQEADRRVTRSIAADGDPGPGDRVRIVGYDIIFREDYLGFPEPAFTTPGQSVTVLDGAEAEDRFHAFIHAPFKDDVVAEARNETSLALQVTIGSSEKSMAGLFLGDLAYTTLRRVFDQTHSHANDDMLSWDVLLAPHHCSKKVMYEKDAGGQDVLKQDILDEFAKAQRPGGSIIVSSSAIPNSNTSGDNPPHAKARNRYVEIIDGEFLCTAEHSSAEDMRPIILTVTASGIMRVDADYELAEVSKADLAKAIAAARGSSEPPTGKVGFGRE
jgi:hypothetical protein